MADPGEWGASNRSLGLLIIPLLAIAFGAAAVLLTGGVSLGSAGTPVGGSGQELLHGLTYEEAGFFGVILIGGWLLWTVYQRLRGNTIPVPAQFLLSALVIFALAIAFIVVVHLFVHAASIPGSPPATGTSGNGGNSTSGPPPPPGQNSTGPEPFPGLPFPSGWPWWVPYMVLGAIGLAIGGLAVPAAISRRRRVSPRVAGAAAPTAASTIRSALAALDQYRGDDPRQTIIALYADLLRAVGHRAGSLDAKTARELSEDLVLGLGVSLSVAQELTDRFEEARYSQRPLGADAVARTRSALAQALEELARSESPP